MIKSKTEQPDNGIEIDLTGPDGSAFVLMGYATQYARQLGYSKEQQTEMSEDMRSGDYDHLLEVFDKHFGEYVTLYR